jgi:hypothetical protein
VLLVLVGLFAESVVNEKQVILGMMVDYAAQGHWMTTLNGESAH